MFIILLCNYFVNNSIKEKIFVTLFAPVLSVKTAILDSFGDVTCSNNFAVIKISDGACYFEYPVIRTRCQSEFIKSCSQ